jgi:hypothetical protein
MKIIIEYMVLDMEGVLIDHTKLIYDNIRTFSDIWEYFHKDINKKYKGDLFEYEYKIINIKVEND